MLKRIGLMFGVGFALWLTQIMPLTIILALLTNHSIPLWLAYSLLLLPVIYSVFMLCLRGPLRRARWWVVQYIGASTVSLSAAVSGALLSLWLDSLVAGVVSGLTALGCIVFAVFTALRVCENSVVIKTSKIRSNLDLLHLSDIHMGSRSPELLGRLVRRIQEIKPSMVLITGDLLDENVSADDLKPLSMIECPVFYSSGNHERYVDYEIALQRIAETGVRVLRDEAVVSKGIVVIGVDDRVSPILAAESLSKVCSKLPNSEVAAELFSVLLYHQPNIWDAARACSLDLMLSGHTHNGQIWPFGWLVRLHYPQIAGYYEHENSHLYVSQGAGTWGPTMRFGTRCEMTLLSLQSIP